MRDGREDQRGRAEHESGAARPLPRLPTGLCSRQSRTAKEAWTAATVQASVAGVGGPLGEGSVPERCVTRRHDVGVEGEVGRFRRSHLVPVPEIASLAELSETIARIDLAEDERLRRRAAVAAAGCQPHRTPPGCPAAGYPAAAVGGAIRPTATPSRGRTRLGSRNTFADSYAICLHT